MKNTKIEWATHTFNPWIGCTKVSPGCANCYAETQDDRRFSKTLPGCSKDAPISHWGKGAPRYRTKQAKWDEVKKWNREEERRIEALRPGMSRVDYPLTRPRVFCASLADWLDDEVPIEWLADLLALIHATQHLDWLLLTKRPENWVTRISAVFAFAMFSKSHHAMLPWLSKWHPDYDSAGGVKGSPIPPANVWIGTTVEDQPRADERIPALLRIPARVRFLSCEPLLGPVEGVTHASRLGGTYRCIKKPAACIDWVIVGCESGVNRRPMQTAWAESLRSQCHFAGVAFFMKQMEVGGNVTQDIGLFPERLSERSFPQ